MPNINPVSDGTHAAESYAPISGRIIGEDGKIYSLVQLLQNLGAGLASQPHLWLAGTEHDFGDGSYGRRFTTTAWIAHAATTTLHSDIGNDVKIIDSGGYVEFSTIPGPNAFGGRLPLGQAYTKGTVFASCALFFECAGQMLNSPLALYLAADTSLTSNSTYKYDVWVRYTK